MAGGHNAPVRHYYGPPIGAVLGRSVVCHAQEQDGEQKRFPSQSAPLAILSAKRSIIVEDRRSRGVLLSVAFPAHTRTSRLRLPAGVGEEIKRAARSGPLYTFSFYLAFSSTFALL